MPSKRFLLAIAAFFLAAPCIAASLADRSPFAQGHWWNPARSGNGFDIFNAVGQVAVTWYSFEENGRPVWYTAIGPLQTLGRQSWPLLRQRWSNGGKAEPTQVGTVKLSVNHAESMGKPNEILYGTRFVGDRLYAVTFKKIDPLYVVDLSDSADPRIAGGTGDGQFAWYQGLLLSLYDVADAGKPRELQRVLMGKRGSESALLRDHHAFSALMNADGTGQFGIPARLNDGAPYGGSGDSTSYSWTASGLMRFELRGTKASDATLVQLPSLITHQPPVQDGTDAAGYNGRSILFRQGTIYLGFGKFWRQDGAGNSTGPF